jgi:hypothetical protein
MAVTAARYIGFATRPDVTLPPATPPVMLGFGSYCFRATVDVLDSKTEELKGCPVVIGQVKAYDTTPLVGKQAESVCRAHVKTLDRTGKRYECGQASLTILAHGPRGKECSGQVYFEVDGQPTKKLV